MEHVCLRKNQGVSLTLNFKSKCVFADGAETLSKEKDLLSNFCFSHVSKVLMEIVHTCKKSHALTNYRLFDYFILVNRHVQSFFLYKFKHD